VSERPRFVGALLDPEATRWAWLIIAVYLGALAVAAVLRVQGDFKIYYEAGSRILGGEPVYRLADSNHFLYAPLFAIFFAPLAMLPIKLAQLAWLIVNAVALVAFLAGAIVMLFGREYVVTPAILILPLLACSRLVNNNIEHGQANLPVLALVVWSIIFAEEGRRTRLSGLALAAAILIKPFAILAALFVALERRWGALAWTAVFGVAILAAPVVILGPTRTISETIAYVHVVSSMTGRYQLMLTNQSASSAFERLFSETQADPHLGFYMGLAVEIALIAGICAWYWRDRGLDGGVLAPGRLPLVALFCVMPSLAPVSWKSYYAALLVPNMAMLSVLWIDRKPGFEPPRAVWILFLGSIALNWVMGNEPNRIALFYSTHFASSIVMLIALTLLTHTPDRTSVSEPRMSVSGG